MKKKNAWVLIWTAEARKLYLVPARDELLSVEVAGEEINLEKDVSAFLPVFDEAGRIVSNYLIFGTRRDAEAFRKGNEEWKSIRCTIAYEML